MQQPLRVGHPDGVRRGVPEQPVERPGVGPVAAEGEYVDAEHPDERIERLKSMWADGATASQIAEDLGGVSRNAVIGKAIVGLWPPEALHS